MVARFKKATKRVERVGGKSPPSEVNKSLSKLISIEHLSLFPKCVCGIWTRILRLPLKATWMIFVGNKCIGHQMNGQSSLQDPLLSFMLHIQGEKSPPSQAHAYQLWGEEAYRPKITGFSSLLKVHIHTGPGQIITRQILLPPPLLWGTLPHNLTLG